VLLELAAVRFWWAALLVASLSLAAGAILTSTVTPSYLARGSWVVTPNTRVEDPTDVMRSLENLERRTIVATFARIATTRDARDAVEKRMGLEEYALADYAMRASVVPYTNLIRFEVEGPEPETATEAARVLGEYTRSEARSMYHIYTLHRFEEARASSRPVQPDWQRNLVISGLLGLFLGGGAALLLAKMRSSPPATAR